MPHATCSRWKALEPTTSRRETNPTLPKILVTGGAGFIGSHVADLFLEKGYEVEIADSLASGKRENVPRKANFHQVSVTSPECARLVREGNFDVVAPAPGQIDVRKS